MDHVLYHVAPTSHEYEKKLAYHGLVATRLRPLLGPIRGLADVSLVGFQTRTSYGVNVYSKTIRQDFMEAWKAAVNWNWETILQIQRGACPSNLFMQFRIGISDATFTRLINSARLRRRLRRSFWRGRRGC